MKVYRIIGFLGLGAGALLAAACSSSGTSDAPPLASTGEPPADHQNWLEGAGDAAWNAVSTPINGLVPKPRPKADPLDLTPTDPPEMVIITRESRGVTVEPPATAPAPATQP